VAAELRALQLAQYRSGEVAENRLRYSARPGRPATSFALYGPYMPLKARRYHVTWRFRWMQAGKGPGAICDVLAEDQEEPIVSCGVRSSEAEASLDFALSRTTFGLQYRCRGTGDAGFAVLRRVALDHTG
jgi:hypothetical protein